MTTISEVVEQIVKSNPNIEYSISQGLLNLSSYARLIRPQIEDILFKDATEAAVMMALKRLSSKIVAKDKAVSLKKLVKDIIVRSNLVELTYSNSDTLVGNHIELLHLINKNSDVFFTLCQGSFETTIIISEKLKKEVEKLFKNEKQTVIIKNLSAITLKLSEDAINVPGLHYQVFKLLSWEGINTAETVSTYTELTIVLDNELVDKAFSVLRKAVNSKL